MTTALDAPTPKSEVKQRQGPGGKVLDYVDARFVMDRLDEAAGAFFWQDKYEDLSNGSVRCCIGIKSGEEWIWKCDVGDPSDIEPMKGAHSDAFKRAGVKWGIGRDLYGDHPAPSKASVKAATELVQEIFPDAVAVDDPEGKCPDHGYTWRHNSRGWYCSGKTAGRWCERRPSIAWVTAANEEWSRTAS